MIDDDAIAADGWKYDGIERYLNGLQEWFFREQSTAYEGATLPDGKWRLLLGTLAYGTYVDRFLDVCVPTLLAPGNISSLPDPLVIIHTDRASVDKLVAGVEARLCSFARVEIHVIPDELVAMAADHPANKYWLLGAANNLHIQQAKYRAHGFHMLMPDHVYAAGYFANMRRLAESGAAAIVQGALSAKLGEMSALLRERKHVVGPADLMAMVLDNLHQQMAPFLMNGRRNLPKESLLVMIGKRAVHICGAHITVTYLSHEVIMRARPRLMNTIDTQLPWLIPDDVEPVMPGPFDGMAYCEVSDEDTKAFWTTEGNTAIEFSTEFWMRGFCTRGYERFLRLTTVLPFTPGYTPPIEPMSEAEIERLQHDTRKAVSDAYDMILSLVPERWKVDPIEWLSRKSESMRASA